MASQKLISSPKHKQVRGLWVVASPSKSEGHLTPKRKVPNGMPPPPSSLGLTLIPWPPLFICPLPINGAGDCGKRLEGISRIIRVIFREKVIFQAEKWLITPYLPPTCYFYLHFRVLRSRWEGILRHARKEVWGMRRNKIGAVMASFLIISVLPHTPMAPRGTAD